MFTVGFEKTSVNWGAVARQTAKLFSRPSVARTAAVGAGTGMVAGAINAQPGEGISGAVRGAALGGLTGGLGAAANRRLDVINRLKKPGMQQSLQKLKTPVPPKPPSNVSPQGFNQGFKQSTLPPVPNM